MSMCLGIDGIPVADPVHIIIHDTSITSQQTIMFFVNSIEAFAAHMEFSGSK